MTPRRLSAYIALGNRRRLGELVELADCVRAAVNGDKKTYDKFRKKMMEESA